MTPKEFVADVLPVIKASWQSHCLCSNPGFRKLLSFNFQDYRDRPNTLVDRAGPMVLVDSEIVGDHIIGSNFSRVARPANSLHQDDVQVYICPQCGNACKGIWNEYSVAVQRTYYQFTGPPAPAPMGLFLIGIGAYSQEDLLRVTDFRQAQSAEEFLEFIGAT